jgi:prefoldin subunit 5
MSEKRTRKARRDWNRDRLPTTPGTLEMSNGLAQMIDPTPATPKPEEETLRHAIEQMWRPDNAYRRWIDAGAAALQTIEQQRAEIERLTKQLEREREERDGAEAEFSRLVERGDNYLRSWEAAREANARLERERDEISALAANGMDKIRTVERERDEARGLLREARTENTEHDYYAHRSKDTGHTCLACRIDAALKEGE